MCAGQYGSLTRVVAPKVYDKISPTKSIDRSLGLGPVAIPPPPPPPQEAKLAEAPKRRGTRYSQGTMLTGSGGVMGGMNTGGSTLLGG
jgi:hypothetical protein